MCNLCHRFSVAFLLCQAAWLSLCYSNILYVFVVKIAAFEVVEYFLYLRNLVTAVAPAVDHSPPRRRPYKVEDTDQPGASSWNIRHGCMSHVTADHERGTQDELLKAADLTRSGGAGADVAALWRSHVWRPDG